MNRSLRSCFLFTVATICFAAFGYAQVRTLSTAVRTGPVYSVKLTATRPDYTNRVDLATTVYSRDALSTASSATVVSDSRLRYAYTYQVTYPCPGPSGAPIISGAYPTHRTIFAYGKGTVTVTVTSVNSLVPPILPAVIGNASATYILPPPPSPDLVDISYSPDSGSHAPVALSIRANLISPSTVPMHFFYNFSCDAGCNPASASLMTYNNWGTTIAAPISPLGVLVTVEEVRDSDCAWLGTASKHEYIYSVLP